MSNRPPRHLTLLLLFSVGCATAQPTLRATPNIVCSGRGAYLEWEGSCRGEISSEPPDASLGAVASKGAKEVYPTESTKYRFRVATLFGRKTSEASVKVVSAPDSPAKIGASIADPSAGCAPGRLWVTARVPAEAWDPQLRIGTVSSSDGRTYQVGHASKTADVAQGSPSSDFRGDRIAGDWKLEMALRPRRDLRHAVVAAVASNRRDARLWE